MTHVILFREELRRSLTLTQAGLELMMTPPASVSPVWDDWHVPGSFSRDLLKSTVKHAEPGQAASVHREVSV